MLERIEEEIGAVLVPADMRRRVRLLDPHRRVIDEDVRPDHVLDRVEHPGMVHQRIGPGVEQVRLALLREVERMALPGLPCFEVGAHPAHLVRCENRRGKGETVALVLVDLSQASEFSAWVVPLLTLS